MEPVSLLLNRTGFNIREIGTGSNRSDRIKTISWIIQLFQLKGRWGNEL